MKINFKKYALLFVSIFIVGTAITLITMAGLGATAITSLPFVISEIWGLSFGLLTGLFNVLWVILQMIILGRDFPKIQLLQFAVAIVLGFSVDLSNALFRFIQPETYLQQLIVLLMGCLTMGFGVFLQLEAKAVYNPSEGIVAAIAEKTSHSFGLVKMTFDSTLVVLSILLGLVTIGQITGIREGTIVSALIIGPFTGMFQKIFNRNEETR